MMAGFAGFFAAVSGSPNPSDSRMSKRSVFLRSMLILLAAALLIAGLAIGDTEEILFKGSIL